MRPSNERLLAHEGQLKTWIQLDKPNWFGYPNLITIWMLPFLGDTRNWHPSMKHQHCRNDLHTVATRGKTSGGLLHVWPKRPSKQICLYNHTHSLYKQIYSTLLLSPQCCLLWALFWISSYGLHVKMNVSWRIPTESGGGGVHCGDGNGLPKAANCLLCLFLFAIPCLCCMEHWHCSWLEEGKKAADNGAARLSCYTVVANSHPNDEFLGITQ